MLQQNGSPVISNNLYLESGDLKKKLSWDYFVFKIVSGNQDLPLTVTVTPTMEPASSKVPLFSDSSGYAGSFRLVTLHWYTPVSDTEDLFMT